MRAIAATPSTMLDLGTSMAELRSFRMNSLGPKLWCQARIGLDTMSELCEIAGPELLAQSGDMIQSRHSLKNFSKEVHNP
jgi:hypothetical protein